MLAPTPASLVTKWFQGAILAQTNDSNGKSMVAFSFDWESPAKGLLLGMLLGELKLWPVVETADSSQPGLLPQDWQGFVLPGLPPTGDLFPIGIGVLFETEKGFGYKVLVLSHRDPVRLIEPSLDADIEFLGLWAQGLPDPDESNPDESIGFLAEQVLIFCGAHCIDWVHVVTSVDVGVNLSSILGRTTNVLYPSLSYNGNTVAIVAIETIKPTP